MGIEFWNGAEAAHRRVMMKAAGYSDGDIRKKPHIGVPNSYMAGSPGMKELMLSIDALIGKGLHGIQILHGSF